MDTLPVTILQFGGGRFLRGFADLFVHQANEAGQGVGRVAVVQSTQGERANLLNARGGAYSVAVQGRENGEVVDRIEPCQSIAYALVASDQWLRICALAESPDLRFMLSNTTEAGLELDAADTRAEAAPPRSFPARVTQLLFIRWRAGLPGLTLLPCELVEANGNRLRSLALEQSAHWNLPDAFREWLEAECVWCDTLVDRIVTSGENHPRAASDPLLVTAEPYALWAVGDPDGHAALFDHPAIIRTMDVTPYALRKVRILNGAHTALLAKVIDEGRSFRFVREAVADAELAVWLRALLFEEIVPVLEGRVENPAAFAEDTLERFANPFLDHKLSDIALYHERKQNIRLRPTVEEFTARFGRAPRLLSEVCP